ASVSTDPAFAGQCRAAAEHVAADLKSIGFETSVRPTEGHPVVVGKAKGPAMTFIEACRAFKAVTGKLPLPITTMIEGEEECGSRNLFKFVRDNAAEFKLDLALVCDTAMWDAATPAITTSLRGLVYEDVKITCADRDLHSGVFGGAAQNP